MCQWTSNWRPFATESDSAPTTTPLYTESNTDECRSRCHNRKWQVLTFEDTSIIYRAITLKQSYTQAWKTKEPHAERKAAKPVCNQESAYCDKWADKINNHQRPWYLNIVKRNTVVDTILFLVVNLFSPCAESLQTFARHERSLFRSKMLTLRWAWLSE